MINGEIIVGMSIILNVILIVECWCLKRDLDLERTLHEQNRERLDKYMRESIDDAETIMLWQKKYYDLLDEFQRYNERRGGYITQEEDDG